MAKYMKNPVIIDAWLWDESHKTLGIAGCEMVACSGHKDRPDECKNLRIKTPLGTGSVSPGDFITKNEAGEYYSCSPKRFAETYKEI